MIRELLAASGPWTIPVALLSSAAAILTTRWQRQDASLRGRIERDLQLWRELPASWASRDQVKAFVEREIQQLTDPDLRHRLAREARAMGGLVLVCLAMLFAVSLGVMHARDAAWPAWSQTALALLFFACAIFVVAYSAWWVILRIQQWRAPR